MSEEEALRHRLQALLIDGLATEWRERAYDSEEVQAVTAALRQLARDDLRGKLVVAGFTPIPYRPEGEEDLVQSCASCMYFERHRCICDLPELNLPVMPEWSCRLWRI